MIYMPENPVVELIDGKYVRLRCPLLFESEVLAEHGYDPLVEIPTGFVFDYESVPRIPIIHSMLAHTSKRGGLGHDYLYRFDSIPTVPKNIADLVYLEITESRGNPWLTRHMKYWGVMIGGGSSYHKLSVGASYEVITRIHAKRRDG